MGGTGAGMALSGSDMAVGIVEGGMGPADDDVGMDEGPAVGECDEPPLKGLQSTVQAYVCVRHAHQRCTVRAARATLAWRDAQGNQRSLSA